MQKTKLEIIDETVEYYSDARKRGTAMREGSNDSSVCCYITSEGNMCAFGRCMIEPKDVPATVFGIAEKISEVFGKRVAFQDLLKEEYRGHEQKFWKEIQELHDAEINFVGGSWSERGRKEIQRLKYVYGKTDNSTDS